MLPNVVPIFETCNADPTITHTFFCLFRVLFGAGVSLNGNCTVQCTGTAAIDAAYVGFNQNCAVLCLDQSDRAVRSCETRALSLFLHSDYSRNLFAATLFRWSPLFLLLFSYMNIKNSHSDLTDQTPSASSFLGQGSP